MTSTTIVKQIGRMTLRDLSEFVDSYGDVKLLRVSPNLFADIEHLLISYAPASCIGNPSQLRFRGVTIQYDGECDFAEAVK